MTQLKHIIKSETTSNIPNPFGEIKKAEINHVMETETQRAIQEVQAAMVIARKFPRDELQATDKILRACTRKTLAESALYSYNRGGAEVSGASIRLAEVFAQNWGHFQYGTRELSQQSGISIIEAFAWDVENNVRVTKTFQVSHTRYSKKNGNTMLTDPRDVYERTANDGARRVRACILAVIPSDVVEVAIQQCEATLKDNADTSPEAIKKLCTAFETLNISSDMLQKRIGNRLDAIRPAQVVQLRKIYSSLKDGMSKVSDWFEVLTPNNTAIEAFNNSVNSEAINNQNINQEGTI